MAYMNQEKKAAIAPKVKAICKKYGITGSLSVNNHSTLVLNIKGGKLDFISNYNKVVKENNRDYPAKDSVDVNTYWYQYHFDGKCKEFLVDVISAMMDGNHNRSDAMSDYFDVGWYINVKIGKWDKPYQLDSQKVVA